MLNLENDENANLPEWQLLTLGPMSDMSLEQVASFMGNRDQGSGIYDLIHARDNSPVVEKMAPKSLQGAFSWCCDVFPFNKSANGLI